MSTCALTTPSEALAKEGANDRPCLAGTSAGRQTGSSSKRRKTPEGLRRHPTFFHPMFSLGAAARIARGKHALRHFARHDAAGADHRARADPHAGQDDRPAAHPHGDERLTLRCPTFREGSGRPENFIAPGPVPSVLPSNVFDGRCSRRVSNPVTPSSIASSSRQVAAAGDPESRGLPTSGDRWVAL